MLFDLKILDEYVDKGLLRKAEDENLAQYNYSEYCNNEGLWDEITLFNRGNIYEKKTGKLIAKAMPKFMNFSQYSEEKQKEFLSENNLIVTEKMDGCLGIIYKYNGEIRYNSRGGFNNYVTDTIKRLLGKYKHLDQILDRQVLIVEVISEQTKIICDYGDEDLYLLTAYKVDTWEEIDNKTVRTLASVLGMKSPYKYDTTWKEMLDWAKTADWRREGFVVQLPNGQRVKIKSEDYLRVAKLKACLNKHSLWKAWKIDIEQGTDTLTAYLNSVPDELYEIANGYMQELKEAMDVLMKQVIFVEHDTRNLPMRALAQFLSTHELKHAVFALRNGKQPERILIKMIEPEED